MAEPSPCDSPSASATDDQGQTKVDSRLRSVLSHPLALPLLYTLHGNNPTNVTYLSRQSQFFGTESNVESTLFNDIFAKEVNDWRKNPKRDEPQLTRALAAAIEARHLETGFHSDGEVKVVRPAAELESTDDGKISGRIDILLTPEEKGNKTETESTPFAIIEVGRHDVEWWKKLDQNIKYLSRMGNDQKDKRLRFW